MSGTGAGVGPLHHDVASNRNAASEHQDRVLAGLLCLALQCYFQNNSRCDCVLYGHCVFLWDSVRWTNWCYMFTDCVLCPARLCVSRCGAMCSQRPKSFFSSKHLESDLTKLVKVGNTVAFHRLTDGKHAEVYHKDAGQ